MKDLKKYFVAVGADGSPTAEGESDWLQFVDRVVVQRRQRRFEIPVSFRRRMCVSDVDHFCMGQHHRPVLPSAPDATAVRIENPDNVSEYDTGSEKLDRCIRHEGARSNSRHVDPLSHRAR